MNTILIVDDEEIVLELMSEILRAYGFNVIAEQYPEKALTFYKDNYKNIDFVILDMIMPLIHGNVLFRKMKEINNEIKAIIISGYLNEEDMVDALRSGIKGYLKKPVKPSEIVEKITDLMEEKKNNYAYIRT